MERKTYGQGKSSQTPQTSQSTMVQLPHQAHYEKLKAAITASQQKDLQP